MIKQKIFKNISWLFFDKIIRVLGGLFIGVWVARYLGPNDFGILNYAIAYTALFVVFTRLGLDQIVVREIVKNAKDINKILGTSFVLKLGGALIAIILISCSLFLLNAAWLTKALIFIIAIKFIFLSFNVVDYYYQSQVLSKYVVIAQNIAFIITGLIKIYLIVYQFEVIYFAYAIVVDAVLVMLMLLFFYQKMGKKVLAWRYDKTIAKKLIVYCWPLAISIFLITVHMRIDQVMIGSMLDVAQVGIYSVAVQLSEAWLMVPSILISTLMPYFISLKERDNKLYYQRLMQLYSIMFYLGIAIGLFIIFFGQDIIIIMFGQEYANAYFALMFNIWNGIFISQALARGIWLIAENLQKYRLYNNIIIVVLNVGLNLILIPKIGISGAAIATLLTQFIGTWVFSFIWKPLRESTWCMIKAVNPMYLFNLKASK